MRTIFRVKNWIGCNNVLNANFPKQAQQTWTQCKTKSFKSKERYVKEKKLCQIIGAPSYDWPWQKKFDHIF